MSLANSGKLTHHKDLNELGLVPLTKPQIQKTHTTLLKAIVKGVSHPNGQAEDQGGAGAYLTEVKPVLAKDLKNVPENQPVALANFGGYNWQVGLGFRYQDSVKVDITQEKVFPEKDRQFPSPSAFAAAMIELLLKGTKDKNPSALGISFGFRHQGLKTAYGLDALIPVDDPAKHWQVKGLANTKLGQLLIKTAQEKFNWQLNRVFITNDTTATALGILNSRLGFVGGEGTNGCFAHSQDNQGQFVNGELGRLTIFPETKLVAEMIKAGRVPPNETGQLAEYFSGGNYLIKQLLQAKTLLKDHFDQPINLPQNPDSSLLTQLATQPPPNLSNNDQQLLQTIAQRILHRAGQTMGILIAGMVTYAYSQNLPQEIPVPAVGSVLFKGKGVLPALTQTLQVIHGSQADQIKIKESSDLKGMAHLTLIEGVKEA